jgi:hypothetical protein
MVVGERERVSHESKAGAVQLSYTPSCNEVGQAEEYNEQEGEMAVQRGWHNGGSSVPGSVSHRRSPMA